MNTQTLALHIKETRDMQKAYFASRNGRYADKKLLDASKKREKELDILVDQVLNEGVPYPISVNDDNVDPIDGKVKYVITITSESEMAASVSTEFPGDASVSIISSKLSVLLDLLEQKISVLAKQQKFGSREELVEFIKNIKMKDLADVSNSNT